MKELIVDFILPEPDGEPMPVEALQLSCGCGSTQFALVSEMKPDTTKGIPASRMYECLACGEYRLG